MKHPKQITQTNHPKQTLDPKNKTPKTGHRKQNTVNTTQLKKISNNTLWHGPALTNLEHTGWSGWAAQTGWLAGWLPGWLAKPSSL